MLHNYLIDLVIMMLNIIAPYNKIQWMRDKTTDLRTDKIAEFENGTQPPLFKV